MKSNNSLTPKIFVKKIDDFHFSELAFPELMQAVLSRGIPFRFRARGMSMKPYIKDGDVITVMQMNEKSNKFGDIIAFIHPIKKNLVVHRIVGKKSGKLLIRGDNAGWKFDGFVEKDNILGKVICIERDGRQLDLRNGLMRYIISLFSLGVVILSNTKMILKRIRNSFIENEY